MKLELTTNRSTQTSLKREKDKDGHGGSGDKMRKATEIWRTIEEEIMKVSHLPQSQQCPDLKSPKHPPINTPLPPIVSAAPFILSPCEYLNSLLLFSSLGRSQGQLMAHHPATSKHLNTHTYTPSNTNKAQTHKHCKKATTFAMLTSGDLTTFDSPRCIHYNACPPLVGLLSVQCICSTGSWSPGIFCA